MPAVLQDLRYAVRGLARARAFSAIAIVTLALGIGANTALFSVVNGVLLNPLPYPHPEQLVALYAKTTGFDRGPAVYLNFLDWQQSARTFAQMAIYRNQSYNLTRDAEGQRLNGLMVSADFFRTLGAKPELGRLFRAEDDRLGAAPAAVLGAGFWRREFGAAQDVLGKPLVLNGASYTIVGVVPASLAFYGQERDVYTPIGQWDDPSFRDRRISVSAHVVGRMRDGVTAAQAQADMDAVSRGLAEAFPVADKDAGVTVVSMKDDIVGNARPFLLALLAAVSFLLLIACANVANLLLARSAARAREFAVRAALGASRGRIARQLLTESLVLGSMGGLLGLLLAWAALQGGLRAFPAALPRADQVTLDGRVLLFTLSVSLLAAIVFGLSPAARASRADLHETLKTGGRGTSGGSRRMQAAFVAIEMGLSVALLAGAGLMVRSLEALWRVDLGFQPSHAITFSVSMPSSARTTSGETRARLRAFDQKMRQIPGVEAVSVTLGSRPMIHDSSLPLWIEGQPKPQNDNAMPQSMFYLVEAGFERAMGLTLERGRFVTEQDDEHAPIVIDIDDAFARDYFPNENPIGRRVNLTQFNVQVEIVGVVGHVRQWGPGGDAPGAVQAEFFYPFMQTPEKLMPMVASAVAVVLRTSGDAATLMDPVRRAVAELDRSDVIYGVQTLDEVVSGALATRRLAMTLLSGFAALALLLACVGIYGVTAYAVGQRTQEIGVRMALGAQRADVMRLILGVGARMALIGLAGGTAAALGLTRLMEDQLFGISADDPLTFVAAAALLVGATLLACYVPARRAVRIDPVAALRSD